MAVTNQGPRAPPAKGVLVSIRSQMAKETVHRTWQPQGYTPNSLLGSQTQVSYESKVLHNSCKQLSVSGLRTITYVKGKVGSGFPP